MTESALSALKSNHYLSVDSHIYIFLAPGVFPMLEYELDIIQRHLDDGMSVDIFLCHEERSFCEANISSFDNIVPPSKLVCKYCRDRTFGGLSWLQETKSSRINIRNFYALTPEDLSKIDLTCNAINLILSSRSEEDLSRYILSESLSYIHTACSSDLINLTRDSDASPFQYVDLYLSLFRNSLRAHFSIHHLCKHKCPDLIYIYNGRMSMYRPVFTYAKSKNIPFFTHEYPLTNFTNYMLVENNYIHDFVNLSKTLKAKVSDPELITENQRREAINWLTKRQSFKHDPVANVLIGSKLSHMVSSKLPKGVDRFSSIISFFTSSEHEYKAIPEWAGIFSFSQDQCVLFLARSFPEVAVVVRVHPNSVSADGDKYSQLTQHNALPNLFIVEATSSLSSHALVDCSDLIITYMSSMGYEAAFKSKPVISMSPHSLYSAFDLTQLCRTPDALLSAVTSFLDGDMSSFPPVEFLRERAIHFAVAFLNIGRQPKYLWRDNYFGGAMIRGNSSTRLNGKLLSRSLYFLVNKARSLKKKLNSLMTLFPHA